MGETLNSIEILENITEEFRKKRLKREIEAINADIQNSKASGYISYGCNKWILENEDIRNYFEALGYKIIYTHYTRCYYIIWDKQYTKELNRKIRLAEAITIAYIMLIPMSLVYLVINKNQKDAMLMIIPIYVLIFLTHKLIQKKIWND